MSSQVVEIRVDAAVIEQHKGLATTFDRCPVAMAMTRTLQRQVRLSGMGWRYGDDISTLFFRPLPVETKAAIIRLIDTGEMEPFTFEVEVPA